MAKYKTRTGKHLTILAAFCLSAGFGQTASAEIVNTLIGNDQNALFNTTSRIRDLLSGNRGSNGGGDQSQQASDALYGTSQSDLMIGGLGIDAMFGDGGDDILIGGTEDFNPFNRDRTFGGEGTDVFLWAPGDGNDFFDGGEGIDVVAFGLIGEQRDDHGDTQGAPFFSVNPPGGDGSQDFDGIFIDPSSGLPVMQVADGPGFCEVVDGSTSAAEQTELTALDLDHLARFILKGPAADTANPDTGLRIALHLKNTEYLVCGGEDLAEIVALDLRTSPPTRIDVSELPPQAFDLILPPSITPVMP